MERKVSMNTRNAAKVANEESKYAFLANGDLKVENAAVIWSNFRGEKNGFGQFKRAFSLVVSDEMAQVLTEEGWNVKTRPGKEEGDYPTNHTEIIVNLDSKFPPKIVKIMTKKDKKIMEQMVDQQDMEDLDNVIPECIDLIIHPFEHGRNNSAGSTVKGYLKVFYVTEKVSASYDDGLGEKYEAMCAGDEEEVPFN